MDPLFFIAGIGLGLAHVLGRHRSRIRLSDAHARRREQIVRSWADRDRAAILRAQEGAAKRQAYGPLTDAQREVYHDLHERIDALKKAA